MSTETAGARERAVVVGSSLAGLLAARVLSDHFREVTILEQDEVGDAAEARKGQPHTRHVHALLPSGLEIMTRYFPTLPERLKAGGALLLDLGTSLRWHAAGGYRVQFESGVIGTYVSRPFLEWEVRGEVLSRPNVTLRDGMHVTGLVSTESCDRIVGVTMRPDEGSSSELSADLVIDATGRGSLTPKWLESLGYRRPPEQSVQIDVRYTSRIYRRRPEDLNGTAGVMVSPSPPKQNRLGALFAVEGDRWIVSMAGWGGDRAPADEEGFLQFAESLPAPDIARAISSLEPLSEIFTYAFLVNRRHHYERLAHFPNGLLVIGDAMCSVNPVYGQGMTTAAMQSAVLDKLLRDGPAGTDLWKCYFRRTAEVLDVPWQMATGEDFRFPTTQGRAPRGLALMSTYFDKVQQTTHVDPLVYSAFIEVLNLTAPPSRLFRPQIVWRVLRNNGRLLRPSVARSPKPLVDHGS